MKRLAGICLSLLFAMTGIGNLPAMSTVQAKSESFLFVRSVDLKERGIQYPAGLGYDPSESAFVIFQGRIPGQSSLDAGGITYIDLYTRENKNSINFSIEQPVEDFTAYDPATRTAFFFQPTQPGMLFAVSLDGSTASKADVDLTLLGIAEMRAMTVDLLTGSFVVLDKSNSALTAFDGDGLFSGVKPRIKNSKILTGISAEQIRSLAVDPTTGIEYLMTAKPYRIIEVNPNGRIGKSWDLSSLKLSDPQGIIFAPSADPTDDPGVYDLNILDSGKAKLIEISLNPAPAVTLPLSSPVQLVKTTQFSLWNPPSPDPAGIAYLPAQGKLLVADSEVDEMPPYFTGKNVFLSTLDGTLSSTCSTIVFSDEPTGAGVNPINNHIFFSDDNAMKVYEINPGADGQYCTGDDTYTSFSTKSFNCNDPEGIAYGAGMLFIADGTARQIYVVSPGLNGKFDGTAPTGDDQVSSFDVSVYGLNDPEGIEYNPDRNTLNIVGNNAVAAIVETTLSGEFVNSYDISSISNTVRSGLAYAPASDNTGVYHFYMVSRGVDNGEDPLENDGKMYEISTYLNLPTLTPTTIVSPTATLTATSTPINSSTPTVPGTATATSTRTNTPPASYTPTITMTTTSSPTTTTTPPVNQAPVVEAGSNLAVLLPEKALLKGSAADDGYPIPPGVLTVGWSKVSGPGNVVFDNASSPVTYASFSQYGTYVLRLTASDGSLATSDTVMVVAMETGKTSVVETRISASYDDAEESPTGTVNRTSSTLELVYDKGNQTVGLRFLNLYIPQNVVITNAYIQFTTSKASSGVTALTLNGEANSNSMTFGTSKFNISSRVKTSHSIAWNPVAWSVVGESGVNQRTSDISPLIQEVVGLKDWSIGNPLTLIVTGTGDRIARSYNGSPASAPLLHIEFMPSATYPTSTLAPIPTNTFTPTISPVPSLTATPTFTLTPTITKTATATLPPTSTSTSTATVTRTPTPTNTTSAEASSTPTPTNTNTPTPSATTTKTATATSTPTVTSTYTLTPSPTIVLNAPPVVNAGVDQVVNLPNVVNLAGTASDDGLPSGILSTTWSVVSGPGPVAFGNPSALNTTAVITVAGTYVLRLTASDGQFSTYDDLSIEIKNAGSSTTLEVRVAASSDDVEEYSSGWMYRTSSDLELIYDSTLQTVGMRFSGITIPKGAVITNAYIQFKVDQASSEMITLHIQGEAAANAATFTSTYYSLSTRPRTTANVLWQPAPWLAANLAGLDQRTPDLSSVIQEIINRSDWVSGNSMVLIITGSETYRRVAKSFDGEASGAPLLHVEYQVSP